jgi:hypothetical protein
MLNGYPSLLFHTIPLFGAALAHGPAVAPVIF